MHQGITRLPRRPARIIALTTAALAVGGAGATAAEPAGTTLADAAATPAVADGRGTFAFGRDARTLRIVDAQSGTRDVTLPASCDLASPDRPLRAVGGGQVLLSCGIPQPGIASDLVRSEPRLVDVRTGELHEPAGLEAFFARHPQQSFDPLEVGGVGISISGAELARFFTPFTLDWRTGAELPQPGSTRADAGEVLDLDRVEGTEPLCAPLTRSGQEDDAVIDNPQWDFLPYAYAAPYGVGIDALGGRLMLQRCGERTRTAITSASAGLRQIGAGIVSGTIYEGAFAYAIGCGVRLEWSGDPLVLDHMRGSVLLSRRSASSAPGWEVRRVPLDGLCARVAAGAGVTLSSAGRSVGAVPRRLTFPDAPTGATSTQVTGLRTRAARLPLANDGSVTVRLARAAQTLSWRIGSAGRWRAAAGAARGWTLQPGRVRSARRLELRVAYRGGGSGTFVARMQPALG